MQSVTDIGTLIFHTPGICGGRRRIADTRVSVRRIAAWYKIGLNAEENVEMGNMIFTYSQVQPGNADKRGFASCNLNLYCATRLSLVARNTRNLGD